MNTFSDIWERDALWLMGPGLLSDVVEFLRGRGFEAVRKPDQPDSVMVALPLPKVMNDVTGQREDVLWAIPPELRGLFQGLCGHVMAAREPSIRERLSPFLGQKMHSFTLSRMNAALLDIEREAQRRGEPMLWELAAEAFGFHPLALPKPARLAA